MPDYLSDDCGTQYGHFSLAPLRSSM